MALSRLKLGFESRWGQHNTRAWRSCAARLVVFSATLMLAGCPSNAERHLQEGHQQAKKAKWSAAAASYRSAAISDPKNAHALALAGLANLKLEDAGAAQESFSAALAVDPLEPNARIGLAGLAVHSMDAGAALSLIEGMTEPSAGLIRGRALLLRGGVGDAEAALAQAKAVTAIAPESIEARYLEGSALLVLGRFAEAQTAFEALEKTSRESPFGPYGLARVAAAQKRSTDVLLYLKAARTASKQSWQAGAVAADPAFAFLAGTPAFIDVVGP